MNNNTNVLLISSWIEFSFFSKGPNYWKVFTFSWELLPILICSFATMPRWRPLYFEHANLGLRGENNIPGTLFYVRSAFDSDGFAVSPEWYLFLGFQIIYPPLQHSEMLSTLQCCNSKLQVSFFFDKIYERTLRFIDQYFSNTLRVEIYNCWVFSN